MGLIFDSHDMVYIIVRNNYRILQWNANSIIQQKHELAYFLKVHRIDIAAICESKLSPARKFALPGHKIYRTDRNNRGGGGGGHHMNRNELRQDSLDVHHTPSIETVAVILYSQLNQPISIVAGYTPPAITVQKDDIAEIFSTPNPTILLGDFNSKHNAWNCTSINNNGKILIDICTNQHITIYAPEQATYYPARGMASVLDIVMARGCRLSPLNQSLHFPLTTFQWCINFETPQHAKVRHRLDYTQANWDHYRITLKQLLRTPLTIHNTKDLDRTIHVFTATIKTAANTSIAKLQAANNLPALPQRIRVLIQVRNYTRRRYQRTRNSALWGILQLLNHWTATSLTAYRNSQWE
jgi:hypothetical protein